MENKNKILEAFKNSAKELKPGEVAELTGLDKKEVDKLIKSLKEEGKIHSPKRCYYSIVE